MTIFGFTVKGRNSKGRKLIRPNHKKPEKMRFSHFVFTGFQMVERIWAERFFLIFKKVRPNELFGLLIFGPTPWTPIF
jgi:hypothetical protein